MRATSKSQSHHDGALDLLKCVLVLGVVLQHSGFSRFNIGEQELVAGLRHFFSLVVVGFFWAAGFLIKPNEAFQVFLKKRFSRLLMPFIAVSLINWISLTSLAHVTGRGFGYDYTLPDLGWVLISLQGVGPQMYFLPYLFLLQSVAFLIERKLSAPWVHAVLSLLLLLLWVVTDADFKQAGPSLGNVSLYASAVFLGMACRHFNTPSAMWIGALGVVPVLAGCAFLPPGLWHDVCCWIAPAALYFAFKQCGARAAWTGINGDTFAVFLWHTPILMPFLSFLSVWLFPRGYLALLATVLGAIVLSIGFGRVLRKLSAAKALGVG
jgi:peptidoglycan/LPS O-acetylase OafA/YrhL